MQFRIADTFADSLARLSGQEQKAVKTTAFDLQLDPAGPGLRFHRLEKARDPGFWSVRVSRDVRLIVHKSAASLLLAYVGHHDDAYRWAERRRIERHPRTGAAQLVELRERVEEIAPPRPAPAEPPPLATTDVPREPYLPPLFLALSHDDLLSVGVPEDWLESVHLSSEDSFLELADHLPAEAAEALLDYVATGELKPPAPELLAADADPFGHPDAQRRFRVPTNVAELERALDYPWEKWTVFLHPAQRRFVERDYHGPARISGSAGTGKTIVALHRAVLLARRHARGQVLLTTFSKALAKALEIKLERLVGNEREVAGRIHVRPIRGLGHELHAAAFGVPEIAAHDLIAALLEEAAAGAPAHRFTPRFLAAEWVQVVDAWQLGSWESYRDVARLGRKTRIGGQQRQALWSIFERLRGALERRGLVTWPQVFGRLAERLGEGGERPFDFAVVDEAQDMGVAEVRFLAALGAARADGLFFAGDLGQRIFQQPFSWKSLGVDIRGRSHTLRINYRTSHQIRSHADRLLPPALADVDGNVEERRGTVSVFNGPAPTIDIFDDAAREVAAVGDWIAGLLGDGLEPHEIGVFVRVASQLERARAAIEGAGARALELDEEVGTAAGRVAAGTMHLAKGLEFRAVAVMACDDEVVPLQERIEAVSDESDLEEVYTTERHLLYVACTRARDHLLVTGVDPASEFLADLLG